MPPLHYHVLVFQRIPEKVFGAMDKNVIISTGRDVLKVETLKENIIFYDGKMF